MNSSLVLTQPNCSNGPATLIAFLAGRRSKTSIRWPAGRRAANPQQSADRELPCQPFRSIARIPAHDVERPPSIRSPRRQAADCPRVGHEWIPAFRQTRRFSAALWSLLCDAHATPIARLHRRCADHDPRVIHCRFGLWPVASGALLRPGGQLLQGFVCPSIALRTEQPNPF